VGTYAHLADYLYYKRNTDNTISFMSKYYRINTAPAGYTRVNWLRSLWNTTTSTAASYVLVNWRGYQDLTGNAPVKYILPIHGSVIANSLGSLKNDGYGF
jgi:hypothetical protein